jgi:hypothetical protein
MILVVDGEIGPKVTRQRNLLLNIRRIWVRIIAGILGGGYHAGTRWLGW